MMVLFVAVRSCMKEAVGVAAFGARPMSGTHADEGETATQQNTRFEESLGRMEYNGSRNRRKWAQRKT